MGRLIREDVIRRGEQMRALMDVNFHGTFNAARAALPVFRHQQRGHAIVVSSIVGRRGIPFMGPYSATKFAQVGLAECLRAEFHGTPIKVSIVYPISTETEFFQVYRPTSLVRRFTSAEEVANLAVYLCGAGASATTGAAMRADGGVVNQIM